MDVVCAPVGNAALQRQLANDEPKCANCKYWDQGRILAEMTHVGDCRLATIPSGAHVYPLRAVTTDLSVCSRWEIKNNQ